MSRLIVVEFNDHNGAIEFGSIVGELVRCKECKWWQKSRERAVEKKGASDA